MQGMQSNLSFEEYSAWCKSRFPPIDAGMPPDSFANTMPATAADEECPVTVRSTRDCVVVTPRPQGSR